MATYDIILFISNVWNRKIYMDKRQIRGCPEPGEKVGWGVEVGWEKEEEVCRGNWRGISFWSYENVLKLMVVMVAHIYGYIKNH